MLLHFYYTLIIAIQILFVPERQHWVATIAIYMDADLKLHNSMFNRKITPSLEEQLLRIYTPLAPDES